MYFWFCSNHRMGSLGGLSPTPGEPNRARQHPMRKSPLLSSPPSISSRSLARSLGRLLSKRRRQGSGAGVASSSSGASAADKVCPLFPFPSDPAVRNRIPKPPSACYLYLDLTMSNTRSAPARGFSWILLSLLLVQVLIFSSSFRCCLIDAVDLTTVFGPPFKVVSLSIRYKK